MKQKIIFTITFAIVMLNALTLGANITDTGEYRLDINEQTKITMMSQDPEYNISSYRDYAEATTDIVISKLMNFTSGRVYHSGRADWIGDPLNITSLATYYWAIAALSKAYYMTYNETYRIAMSRAVTKMVSIFMDPTYPGYYVNEYADPEITVTKRPGVQAYAYWALEIAESTNNTLSFTLEKESALRCLTEMLYDSANGGFYFYTMRNGSLNVPVYFSEVYPNDGKRLDHLVLGASLLYDVGSSSGNSTLLNMADEALSFMIRNMKYYYEMEFRGFKLAVNSTGGSVDVGEMERVAHSIVTDINAMTIRALIKSYDITGNTTHLNLATNLFETLIANNWDGESGGWFTEIVDGEPYDPLEEEDVKYYKYAEIQFQMILALEDLYVATDSIYPIRMVIDTLELTLGHLWDPGVEGFVKNGNQIWAVFDADWRVHYTTVKAQAIIGLERMWRFGLPIVSNVRISPTNPRPGDIVYFIVTARDDDGIDFVYVNYTMNVEGNTSYGNFPLIANPEVGGVYNNSIAPLDHNTEVNFEIVANDTTGRSFIAGIYYFIVRTDTFAPTAELHAIYPTGEVRAGDLVTIDFETYEFPEQSHTNSCEIRWRMFDALYVSENMTPIGVEDGRIIWRIELGRFNGGDQISFFCLATDEAGNVGESRLYLLTILAPVLYITPIVVFQIVAAVGLIAAPGVGYVYTRRKKQAYREIQREGKKNAQRRARKRGTSRRRKQK